MAWVLLLLAGLCEIGWAIGLKYTNGFSALWPTVWTVAAMIVSIVLLGLAAKVLPIGTAYAVWGGIGAVGTVIVGILWFHEPSSTVRVLLILAIVAAIACVIINSRLAQMQTTILRAY